MDVVKRNIEGMGGRVEIDSQQGFGTKIIIRLPLTLAILDGMSVSTGDEIFILRWGSLSNRCSRPRKTLNLWRAKVA